MGWITGGMGYQAGTGETVGESRWIGDLADAVKYLKGLGFSRVVVLGHSLGWRLPFVRQIRSRVISRFGLAFRCLRGAQRAFEAAEVFFSRRGWVSSAIFVLLTGRRNITGRELLFWTTPCGITGIRHGS